MKILWCITGAGHFLEEVCKILNADKRKNTITTCAISSAGEEVIKMYDVDIKINEKNF